MVKRLFDEKEMDRALMRIGHEIVERNEGAGNLCIVGIQKGGVHLAHRLALKVEGIEGNSVSTGSLDVSFYRDDIMLRQKPEVNRTEMDFDITGMVVVLVDDVIFSGRTIRAAMDALMDHGRPTSIQLAVLVDRGHRELPIRADYVGKNIPTSPGEKVEVKLSEDGHVHDSVEITEGEDVA